MDPQVLRDIAEGLIKNAIENTPDGGVIRIGLEQKDDRILLSVTDTGIGITKRISATSSTGCITRRKRTFTPHGNRWSSARGERDSTF
jgi:light-regulated signal transduction histidine kinase (bacteriophytochrome)